MSLVVGSKLSFYEVLAAIGAGTMGEVYRAMDTRLGREVAIKVLPEHFADEPERLKRFEREAKTLASLNHPNVAQIFGVDQVGNTCFLVLEFVPGESLDERLKRGPLPLDEALDVCKQIAEGLEAAHEAGVIHRDLKPANVLLTPDGRVKVFDFGLAKTAKESGQGSSTDSVLSTEVGRLLGTPTYMAPEQARGKAIDRRVDIWAFGCVLFECLTAKRAFAGETLTDVLGAVLHSQADLSALPPSTPRRVRDLIESCFVKDPRRRLRDIGQARLEIESILAGHDETLATAESQATRKRPAFWVVAVAAAVLMTLGAWLWSALTPHVRVVAEPTCVSVAMPPDIVVDTAQVTCDGRTLIVRGWPRASSSRSVAQQRFYARRLDRFEFEPLAGTEGALFGFMTRDSRGLRFVAPVSPGSTHKQLAFVPLDGSSPATTLAEWQDGWGSWVELASGEVLISDHATAFMRLPKAGGPPSAPVQMDAGRPGVQRFELHLQALPGDRGVLVNVLSYSTRGFQYGVGVLDPVNGHVKVVVEDGGNAAYSPTGHLVFARGDVILAAPFDLERAEVLAAPVAVWSGLDTPARSLPGWFRLTDNGALGYEPGQGEMVRSLALLTEGGSLKPWSSEGKALSMQPEMSPDGRRLLFLITNARLIDELWVSPVDHADFVKIPSDANADSFDAVWSPDSRRVAYRRMAKDDRDGVYIQDVDGGRPRRVLAQKAGEEDPRPTAWFSDDSALLLSRRVAGKASILLLPLGDAETDASSLRPFLPSEFNRSNARLSKDGRLVAFTSGDSGTDQTWVADLRPGGETGRPLCVRTSGSYWQAWAADGKTLFVEDAHDRIQKVVVSFEPQLSVSDPVEVANLEQHRIGQWAVLPDGRFFVSIKSEGEAEIRRYDMVLDWTERLKKQLSAAR